MVDLAAAKKVSAHRSCSHKMSNSGAYETYRAKLESELRCSEEAKKAEKQSGSSLEWDERAEGAIKAKEGIEEKTSRGHFKPSSVHEALENVYGVPYRKAIAEIGRE